MEVFERAFFKGELFWIDFPEGLGSVQSGVRPAIITSNNKFNRYAPIIQASPITKQDKESPVHIPIGVECGLDVQSWILIEQDTTISKDRIKGKIGYCGRDILLQMEEAFMFQKGINPNNHKTIEPFDISKAYKYLDKLYRISRYNKKLEECGLLSYEDEIERKSIFGDFKEYCVERNINYNIINKQYLEYKNGKNIDNRNLNKSIAI